MMVDCCCEPIVGSNPSGGTPGPPGAAATIAVGTTTTLAAGSPATVVNVGTSSAAIFDFGIPEGTPGASGVTRHVKTGTQNMSAVALTIVTDLAHTFSVAGHYGFEAFVQFNSTNANTNVFFDWTATNVTYFTSVAIINYTVNASVNTVPCGGIAGTTAAGTDIGINTNLNASATNYVAWIKGVIQVSAASTLQLRAAPSNGGGPTINILINSTLDVWTR